MNPQNHPQIYKSLVLAHNIHKDCLLGVAKGFSDIYGAKHSPPSSAQRGPKGNIKVSTQKCVKSTSNASFWQSMDPQTKLENVYDQNTFKVS